MQPNAMKKRRELTVGHRSAQRRRRARELWSLEKAAVRRGGKRRLGQRFSGRVVTIRLTAPPSLGIIDPQMRTGLFDFLTELRNTSVRSGVQIVLDFSRTERIHSSGAAFLIAEIARAKAVGVASLQGRRSSTPLVEEVLQQIGVYESLGLACDVPPQSESVIHWRVATGTLAEGVKGGSILEQYDGRLAEGLTKGLYDGLVEAMTNTVHHAYPDTSEGRMRRHGVGKRWWMLSQEKDGELTVAICDLGIGIPKSLPRTKTYSSTTVRDFWRNSGLDRSDGSAISVAVQLGRTSTQLKQRGKGLADIVEAVRISEGGVLMINSNRGIFTVEGAKESVFNHSRSSNGTLINWTVPILKKGSVDD